MSQSDYFNVSVARALTGYSFVTMHPVPLGPGWHVVVLLAPERVLDVSQVQLQDSAPL